MQNVIKVLKKILNGIIIWVLLTILYFVGLSLVIHLNFDEYKDDVNAYIETVITKSMTKAMQKETCETQPKLKTLPLYGFSPNDANDANDTNESNDSNTTSNTINNVDLNISVFD